MIYGSSYSTDNINLYNENERKILSNKIACIIIIYFLYYCVFKEIFGIINIIKIIGRFYYSKGRNINAII